MIIQFNLIHILYRYSNIIIKYNSIVLLVVSVVKLVIKTTIIEYSNEKLKPITCKREFNLRKSMKATGTKIKFKSIKFTINYYQLFHLKYTNCILKIDHQRNIL